MRPHAGVMSRAEAPRCIRSGWWLYVVLMISSCERWRRHYAHAAGPLRNRGKIAVCLNTILSSSTSKIGSQLPRPSRGLAVADM